MRSLLAVIFITAVSTGCSTAPKQGPETTTSSAKKLGIRPNGDTTISPDLSKTPEDLKKVYAYIDEHIDEHVENLQKWIQQPSISNTGEGIPESAEMVKGFFEQLGCQESRVYEPGITEYGTPANPVVFAKCDEGQPLTVAIYWQLDTMPVTQPDAWKVPPFEARIVDGNTINPELLGQFRKVLIGRGATNSKGPEMATYNAVMSMKKVLGKLPVNLIWIVEGDEERMDIGLRKFVKDHPELLKADAMMGGGVQSNSGAGSITGGSEGCVNFELTTSGKAWGRGPTDFDIHGSNKRQVDSPAWRHIMMLASLVTDMGNKVKVQGFYDNMEPLSPEEDARLKAAAAKTDMKIAAMNIGVARFISDDPYTMLKQARYGTSFNIDGIFGGNMFAGGAGAILPNKVTSKHNLRYIPNMHGPDLVKKIRAQLDKNGFQDVQLKLIGDVPWAKMAYNNDAAKATTQMFDAFGIPYGQPSQSPTIVGGGGDAADAGGYWPAYLFGNTEVGEKVAPVSMPIARSEAGHGGMAHASNEYYVIEGAGKVYGMAGAEKSFAANLYYYSRIAKPKGTSAGN